jgi:hypothetical protein
MPPLTNTFIPLATLASPRLGMLAADSDLRMRLTAWGYMDHLSMLGVEWAYSNMMDSWDTLEELCMKSVADVLQSNNKLAH